MANVKFKNVGKIHQNIQKDGSTRPVNAVTDLNLEIKDGELIVLVGPSGCGKTSVMYMAAGLDEITSGELYIDDIPVNNVEPKDRGIAMMFHNYALFPFMTAYENIAFGLQPTDMTESEIKEKVEEVASIFPIDYRFLTERKPNEMSAGEKGCVALARALVRKNKVVLLDEPLSNLDAKLRAAMRKELLRIHQKLGTTFIYVTHDQAEAMAIADRIVIMNHGVIQQVGTPEELYSHPCNVFVAAFLGSPMINLWDTKVTEQGGDIFINCGEVKIKLPENKADKASAYIGKEVWAGIRPEEIYVWEASAENYNAPHHATIAAKIEVREFLGDRIYLHCVSENIPFTVRMLSQYDFDLPPKSGDEIKVGLHRDKIYLFDKDTEMAIF